MEKNDIERLLRLQSAAYELLLWVARRAEHESEMLSDANLDKWRHAESCESWVSGCLGMIPLALRPEPGDVAAFARLFSAFFHTSFRVEEVTPVRVYDDWGEPSGFDGVRRRRLVAGAPSGKKSPKGKAKVAHSAHELRLIALEELALEHDMMPSRADLEAIAGRAELREALTLWTYIHELDRRTRFSSQGEAVRSLWQAMDKKQRESISADKALAARGSLLLALGASST